MTDKKWALGGQFKGALRDGHLSVTFAPADEPDSPIILGQAHGAIVKTDEARDAFCNFVIGLFIEAANLADQEYKLVETNELKRMKKEGLI